MKKIPLTLALSPGALWHNMKYTASREGGERWLGGKDLERHPLIVWIQVCQDYESIPFPFNADSPYQKEPAYQIFEAQLPLPSDGRLRYSLLVEGGGRDLGQKNPLNFARGEGILIPDHSVFLKRIFPYFGHGIRDLAP